MKIKAILPIALISLLMFNPTQANGASWYTYQGNSNHDGFVDGTINPAGIKKIWEFNAEGDIKPVAVGANKVFIVKHSWVDKYSVVSALDTQTGQKLWDYQVDGDPYDISPPAFDSNKIYFQISDRTSSWQTGCFLKGLDSESGNIIFTSPLNNDFFEYFAPTPFDNTLYTPIGEDGEGISAFDATSGVEKWLNPIPLHNTQNWTPAVDKENIYVYTGDLHILDRETGDLKGFILDKKIVTNYRSASYTPVLTTANNITVINSNRLKYFDVKNQVVAWDISRNFSGQPSVHEEIIYAISNGQLTAVEESSGKILWQWAPPKSRLKSNIILTEDYIIVGNDHLTFILDKTTREMMATIDEVGDLAMAEGKLFIKKKSTLSAYSL